MSATPVASKDEYANHQIICCIQIDGTLVADGTEYRIKPNMGFLCRDATPTNTFQTVPVGTRIG